MKFARKLTLSSIVVLFAVTIFGQDIHYNYDRNANFSAYKTYQWQEPRGRVVQDQLTDQNIRRAVDEQLAAKGLEKVEKGGDLDVSYLAAVNHEKQINRFGMGPRWRGGMGMATTSTIQMGTLVIELNDPARKQLVWRGSATKTLNPSKDPDKNYKNLEKSMAKLFKKYPPPQGTK